ncbi:MAG: SagB/ThcOx family dehydrogenase [Chloroflexi bacterium]|nr:SagB/ThcOx family dehydrogenase [Chloroflexota bacterium]
MANHDIKAALHYHNGTKHPDGYLMDPWHSYDPMNHPLLFKTYLGLEPIPFPPAPSPSGVPTLSAISRQASATGTDRVPDLNTLSSVLHFSAGITKRINYPWGEMAFRAAACTGALYHIELYLVCGELPGLEAGVYHFDPAVPALRRLRTGDYRATLAEASGDEPAVAQAAAVIVYSDVIWRNSCKYQAREYRHAFWDSGTILANTLAMASAHGIPARVVLGFVDESVNRLLDLDARREVSLALVTLGYAQEPPHGPPPTPEPLSLETVPISDHEVEFPAILEMHEASSLTDKAEVESWRGSVPVIGFPSPTRPLVPLDPYPDDGMPPNPIETVIVRRGSTRRFSREAITFRQLSTILQRATRGIPADFLGPSGETFSSLYLIVNAVDGLPSGSYVFHRDQQGLELLEEGDFRLQSGSLGLHQALPADASVDIFILADLDPVLERFGNRGYRAAQLEASITAGKVYLAAYAQRLGATGLTFYDDAVTQFFSPHAEDKSAMFLVAVGKRAPRQLIEVETGR